MASADGTEYCVYRQWFLEVFLGPFSNVNNRIMPMSDAVTSEGPKTTGIQQRSSPCPLRTEISPVSLNLFFVINIFLFFYFFHTQHNIISKIQKQKQKKTDTYSTSQGPIKREGRGKDNKNTKVTPLYNHVCPTKKHCQASMVEGLAPPTRAVHMTLFAGGYGSNMFFYTCVV